MRIQCGTILAAAMVAFAAGAAERTLTLDDYRDKMKGAWIGQMVGVSWGQPTEFKWKDEIIPETYVPEWKSDFPLRMAYGNDDLYVEMTFLKTLEEYGLDATIRQAGIDFANSEYRLWCANKAGRDNLRLGIAPPDSSHPGSTSGRTTSTTRSRPTIPASSRPDARRRRFASATCSGG